MTRPALSRAVVDRDAGTREDDAALAAAWERSRVLVVDDGTVLVDDLSLVSVGPDDAPPGDRLYLGRDDDGPWFAVAGPLPAGPGAPATLRDVGARLGDRDAGLLVHAVGLANWHRTHPRCSRCGAPTESVRGGSVRRCTEDGSDHFPRTDPAIIVLVTDGADRCVLGRQPVWPPRRFSTLAGFVEPGESLEQAVVREVAEESGLAVRDVVYRDSQPWPFPASLMLGFRAVCDGDVEPVTPDGELAEVGWFTREQVRAAGDWSGGPGPLLLPTPVSIAWKLITDWAAEAYVVRREGRQALEGLSRLGIAARGLVWLVLSFLAAQVALGRSAQADQQGALRTLSDTPLGGVLLAVLAVGFLGYAVALGHQATLERENVDRVKAVGKSGLYLLLALAAGRFVVGGGGSGQDPKPLTGRLLSVPFGRLLVGAVALVVVGVGVWFAVRAVRHTHEDRIKKWGLGAGAATAVRRIGVAGHLGRALVILLLGAFVTLAAVRADADEAKGLDEALQVLAGEPHGPVVLGAVVLGALCYALWSFAEAALHRPGST